MGGENVRYRKLYPRFWRDEKVLTLTLEEKAVAFYCLTGPQSNRCGIYVLSPGAAAEDCGTLPQTFAKRFGVVVKTLFWKFDSTFRVLYIPRWWKWNRPDNPNVFQACLADIKELPQCSLLQEFMSNSEYLPETFRVTFANVLSNVGGNPRAQEQEQEQEFTPIVPEGTSSVSTFADWYKLYPKKCGKEAAKKAYTQAVKRLRQTVPDLTEAKAAAILLQAVQRYAESPKGHSRYCWNPATWLNQGHWEDDPAVWERGDEEISKKPEARQSELPYLDGEPKP